MRILDLAQRNTEIFIAQGSVTAMKEKLPLNSSYPYNFQESLESPVITASARWMFKLHPHSSCPMKDDDCSLCGKRVTGLGHIKIKVMRKSLSLTHSYWYHLTAFQIKLQKLTMMEFLLMLWFTQAAWKILLMQVLRSQTGGETFCCSWVAMANTALTSHITGYCLVDLKLKRVL